MARAYEVEVRDAVWCTHLPSRPDHYMWVRAEAILFRLPFPPFPGLSVELVSRGVVWTFVTSEVKWCTDANVFIVYTEDQEWDDMFILEDVPSNRHPAALVRSYKNLNPRKIVANVRSNNQ